MASRAYRYVKPRRLICGRKPSQKHVWLLSMPGSRMHSVRTLSELVRSGEYKVAA